MSEYFIESEVAAFEGGINYEWAGLGTLTRGGNVRPPRVIANELEELGMGLDDMLLPMGSARQILVDNIKQNFDTESDPDNISWTEWSESYVDSGGSASSSQILRKTDDLYDAATDPLNYPILEEGRHSNDLFVNTGNFPPYWAVHQRGSKGTPARPYIGLSEEGAFDVIRVFDIWMQDRVNLFMSGSGRVHFRGAGRQIGALVGAGHGQVTSTPMLP